MFPEGGGQPCDTGYIDQVKVHNVQREKIAHVHFTKEPVEAGKTVELNVDWDRRWDHVQQHSGQHLLSAVLESEPYKWNTLAWSLGEKRCYIELDTNVKSFTPEVMKEVEVAVNNHILRNTPVIIHSKPADHEDTHRPDSVPADYVGGGSIRIIEIEGLDWNPCCGTHVQSIGQIQAVKLLHAESVRGGNTRLFFLCGKRVVDTLETNLAMNRQLTALLSCPPENFVENVDKIQKTAKENMKKAKRLLESLATYTVNDVEASLKDKPFALVYKEDADMEFLTMVANVIRDRALIEEGSSKVVLLAAGDKKTGGPVIITGGSNDIVQKTGKILTSVISGVKGGGRGRWQGKAQNWTGVENLEKALEDLQL